MCVCVYIHTHTMCVCVCVCMYVCRYIYTHIYSMYVCRYIYTYIHTHRIYTVQKILNVFFCFYVIYFSDANQNLIRLYTSLQCHIILQKSFQHVDLLSMLFFYLSIHQIILNKMSQVPKNIKQQTVPNTSNKPIYWNDF